MTVRTVTAAVLLVLVIAAPAGAQEHGVCGERFPEADWVRVDAPVDVYATGVPDGHAARYAAEIGGAVEQITGHFGPFDATVCLIDRDSGFDQSRFVSGGERLHALLLVDEGLLLLSTENVGLTGSAAGFGLGHIAMWQYSDGVGFPEPQATTIAQYYRSEVRDRAVFDHAEAKSANFYGPAVVTPWGAGVQSRRIAWDPSLGRGTVLLGPTGPAATAASPASTHMADLVRFGLADGDAGFITDPDPQVWAGLEARWRTSLTVELMGTEEPTTTWRYGLAIAIGIVVVAIVAAVLGVISKRRRTKRPDTPDPIPGFFDPTSGSPD